MTLVGFGGVQITQIFYTEKFKQDFKKLPPSLQEKVKEVLKELMTHPRPRSLRFEKLNGIKNPSVFTIHVTSNHSHKVSFALDGSRAILRRIGTHKLIDRSP